MTGAELVLLGAAGTVAGAVNAVAGGGSLLTFPALLAAGLPPLAANVTNAVGLLPGYAAATLGYRHELAGQGGRVRRLLPAVTLGSALGCAALVGGTPGAFVMVVPFLVLAGCVLLAVQPRVAARATASPSGTVRRGLGLSVGSVVCGAYGAYFGAALGVALLGVLGMFVPEGLQRLNALKSLLSLAVALLSTGVFLWVAPVDLADAAALAAGSLLGGRYGALAARRMPERALRASVICVGVLAAFLLVLR